MHLWKSILTEQISDCVSFVKNRKIQPYKFPTAFRDDCVCLRYSECTHTVRPIEFLQNWKINVVWL